MGGSCLEAISDGINIAPTRALVAINITNATMTQRLVISSLICVHSTAESGEGSIRATPDHQVCFYRARMSMLKLSRPPYGVKGMLSHLSQIEDSSGPTRLILRCVILAPVWPGTFGGDTATNRVKTIPMAS